MKHWIKNLTVVCLFASATANGWAQQQMPPIPVDPAVRIGQLDNGLTYYIRHNELPAQRADFYIAQKVGSILEEDNQRGLAHFLEHMCFNGTTNFPGKSLIQYLETIGVRFGENLNAYTSIDETVYNIDNVPVTRDGVVDSCLLILHDWSHDLTLADDEIDNERGVIHEEWRTRSNAMLRMYDTVLPVLYPGNRYGERMPIGLMEVVDNFAYQALRDYYQTWYRPDQQGIVVVGDVDVDRVEAKIKELFAPIPMPKDAKERIYPTVDDNDAPLIAIASDKEQTTPVAQVSFKHEVVPVEMRATLPYLVQNYITSMIEDMLDARLNELRQQAEPPFINAGVGDGDFMLSKTKGAFTGMVQSKEDGMPTALSALLREMWRAQKFGFTESEYSRAKAEYLRQLESAYNEREKTKNNAYVNEYVRHFIDNEPIPGIEQEYAIMNQLVPNIPLEAINQTIQQLVHPENVAVAIYYPEKEGLTPMTEEEVLALLQQAQNEELTAYVDQVSDEPLITKLPKAGKVKKTATGPFGSTVYTLSNGVRVVIKKTDFKADEIRMSAFSEGGSSLFPDEDIIQIKSLNQVAGIGGLGNFSQVNLEKALAGKKASIRASVGNLTEGVNGSCSPTDFETLMQLTYLTFTAPRTDEDAFASFKTRLHATLANQEANPIKALSDTLRQALYAGHPRSYQLKSEDVERIDYAKIMQMYNDRFKDASDFTFLFVGNIEAEEAKPLIEQYLGALPVTKRKETWRDNGVDYRKGQYQNVFEKQLGTPKATVLLIFSGQCAYSLKNELLMSMTSQILDIMYTASVREQEGGTYGVSAYGELEKRPKEEAMLQIYFDTDPARRADMTAIVQRELNLVATEGPSEENLAKVKEFMLKKHAEDLKENGYWLGQLDNYFEENIDLSTDYEQTLNAITTADVQQFLKALLDQQNRIEVSMTSPGEPAAAESADSNEENK
jgi:zinc protease